MRTEAAIVIKIHSLLVTSCALKGVIQREIVLQRKAIYTHNEKINRKINACMFNTGKITALQNFSLFVIKALCTQLKLK